LLPPEKILANFDKLPDSAVVSTAVAALHDGVAERTVRRNYPLVQLTERRYGVLVGYLRHRKTDTFKPIGDAADRVVDKLTRSPRRG
jgi:hypothetical protein